MADVVSREVRSRMMAGIRSKDTKPEIAIRTGLHSLGFRFRLHDPNLVGRPDLVFPKYRAVIFVHGCFWHGHGCHLFRRPKTRPDFWLAKIKANKARDNVARTKLATDGWRVAEVRECAMKGRNRRPIETIVEACAAWLKSESPDVEITGTDGVHDASGLRLDGGSVKDRLA